MTDRFDLETEIMGCWNITSELKSLAEAVCDKNLSNDSIANILIGLTELYNLKFDKTFGTFEQLVRGKQL